MNEQEIIILGTAHCTECQTVKTLLKNKKVSFLFVDIDKQGENPWIAKAIEAGFTSLPIIVYQGAFITVQTLRGLI